MYKRGGDSYVTSVKYGAQYIGAYTSTTESVETKMALSAELEAKISAANFKGNLKMAIDEVNKSKKANFRFTQHAVGWPNKDLPTEETLGDFVNRFNNATIDTPDVLAFETRLYEDVKGCPDMDLLKSAYERYTRDMHGKHAYSTIERQARKTKAAIETVRAVYTFYRQADMETGWDTRLRGVQEILNQLGDWKHDVQMKPTSMPKDLILDERSLELPVPRYSFVTPGYAGQSDRGDPWEDLTLDQVMECVYPRSIQVRSGGVIDKLITVYGYEEHGKGTFERVHGEDGGTLSEKLTLTPQDRISRVDAWDWLCDNFGYGEIGSGIRFVIPDVSWKVSGIKIRIEGSTEGTTFGPCNGNQHPQVSSNDKWCVIGWTGRSKSLLDFLKAVYVRFEKPEWTMPKLPDTSS